MTPSFESLFGIPKNQIQPICLITPFLTKSMMRALNLKHRFKGKPYSGFLHSDFTLIETHLGPLFNGDAVLHLKESPCHNLLFIGSCGSLKSSSLPIGSIVSPSASYAIEGFCVMAEKRITFDYNIPATFDATSFFSRTKNPPIKVQCASIGSIALEIKFQPSFEENNIDVLDMECASIFCAAKTAVIQAAALLYVTDIIGTTSPFAITSDDILKIEDAQKKIAKMALSIAENYADRRSRC